MKEKTFKYIPAQISRNFHLKALLFVLLLTRTCFSGSVFTGTVTDENGRPVRDVNIRLLPTTIGTVTDEKGNFYFPRQADGEYRLEFEHVSYKRTGIAASSGTAERAVFNIVLQAAEVSLEPIEAYVLSGAKKALVIGTKDISTSAYASAHDVLRSVPDFIVEDIGGSGTKISVRGTDAKHTSVYIDGVLMNSALDKGFDLRTVPSETIDKIEIYRSGDLATTAQSVGAVILITTKTAGGRKEISASYTNGWFLSDRDEVSLQAMNNHDVSCSASFPVSENCGVYLSYSGKRNDNRWSYINAAKADEYRYIDIDSPNVPRIMENAYVNSDNISGSFSYERNSFRGRAGINISGVSNGLPGWYDQSYEQAFSEKKGLILNGSLERGSEKGFFFRLEGSYDIRKHRTKIEEIAPVFYSDTEDVFYAENFKISSKYAFSQAEFRAGAEYFSEEAESRSLDLDGARRDIYSLFAKASGEKYLWRELLKGNISGAVRRDVIPEPGLDKTLFSAGAGMEFIYKKFSASPSYSFSQSYSLPSFAELFWADNLFSSGNPELDPELCVQHEISLSSSVAAGYFRLRADYAYYDKKLEDLIVWINRNNGKYIPENFKAGRITGHEVRTTVYFFEKIYFTAGYNKMDARQYTGDPATDGKRMIYKPGETLSVKAGFDMSGYHAELSADYTGVMYLNETNSIDIYPYRLIGAAVSKEFQAWGGTYTIMLKGHNLQDEQYQVIYGYPMPGRKFETTIKFKF